MKILSTCVGLTLVMIAGAVVPRDAPRDQPRANGTTTVAFVLTQGATMIDFAGPWEVFIWSIKVTGGRRGGRSVTADERLRSLRPVRLVARSSRARASRSSRFR